MATVLFRSQPALLCTFTLEVRYRERIASTVDEYEEDRFLNGLFGELLAEGEASRPMPGAHVITFPDPVDALLGLRTFFEALDRRGAQALDLMCKWCSAIASIAAVELLLEDAEPARSARAWLDSWIAPDGVARPGRGVAYLCDGRSTRPLVETELPRAIARDELPTKGLVLWHVNHHELGTAALHHITHSGYILGRDRSADLQLTDLTIARQHVRFLESEDGWSVEDLASPSGFYMNDMVRGRGIVPLVPGAVLRIGREQLVVLVATASAS